MSKTTVKPGDYVLATKYSDGDPMDQFYVGFVAEVLPNGRHIVTDANGISQRANGFRRAEKITQAEGAALCAMIPHISDQPGPSLWAHLERIRNE